MSSVVYFPEDLPVGSSWVKRLNAADAVRQCEILGLVPAATLAENRVILAEFVATLTVNGGSVSLPEVDPVVRRRVSEAAESLPLPEAKPEAAIIEAVAPAQWQGIVQATALAVGTQVATAMAQAMAGGSAGSPAGSSRCLDQLIAAIPLTSGVDPKLIVRFLVQVTRIQQLGLMDDAGLLLAILPRTSHRLRNFWLAAVANKSTLTGLIAEVLDFFVPKRQRHSLVSELIYRVQGQRETLSEFIFEVRELSGLLMPDVSEADLLETILIGLNQATRARIGGFPAPASVEELLALAPKIQVIQSMEVHDQATSRVGSLPTRQIHFQRPEFQRPRPFYRPHPGFGRNEQSSAYRRSIPAGDGSAGPPFQQVSTGQSAPKRPDSVNRKGERM